MSTKIKWFLASAALFVCAIAVTWPKGGSAPTAPASGTAEARDQRPAPPNERVLKLAPDTLDFGQVEVGEKKALEVEVHNPSAKDVLIYRMLFSCSCLAGSAEKLVVPSGGTVYVPISFMGQPGKRNVSATASLVTDEPGACKYELSIRGQVLQEYISEPDTLNFGRFPIGESRTAEAVLRRSDGKTFSVRALESGRSDLSLAWKREPGNEAVAYRITATFAPARSGTLGETVTLVTEPRGERIPVFVAGGEVNGTVTATPEVLSAAWEGDRPAPVFEVTLRSKSGKPVVVTEVKDSAQSRLTFTQNRSPSGETVLRLTFETGSSPKRPIGQFSVTVEGEPEPLRIPYRIKLPRDGARQNP